MVSIVTVSLARLVCSTFCTSPIAPTVNTPAAEEAVATEPGITFAEIGRVLHVSESRVCQVHGRAIRSLRDAS